MRCPIQDYLAENRRQFEEYSRTRREYLDSLPEDERAKIEEVAAKKRLKRAIHKRKMVHCSGCGSFLDVYMSDVCFLSYARIGEFSNLPVLIFYFSCYKKNIQLLYCGWIKPCL